MIKLTTPQTIYVVLLVLSVLLIVGLISFLIIKAKYMPHHIKERTYLKLSNFCQLNDYLLLNNYKINIDDNNVGTIDHIVISNKFIILINDFALSGILYGDYSSDNLSIYNKKGALTTVNPLNYNINLSKRLALFNDLSQDLIKGLVVIDNESKVNVSNTNNQFKIIRLCELRKTIKRFDRANVKDLKEDDVVRFINYLDEQNKKHENKI